MKYKIIFKLIYYSLAYLFIKNNFFSKIRTWGDIEKNLINNPNKMKTISKKKTKKSNIDTKKIKDFNEDIYPLY